uniref:Uncharacterized protein n=1 Tax=Proboscia inermis TaxID=420281 RepID=A0A7S0CHV1_9STRA
MWIKKFKVTQKLKGTNKYQPSIKIDVFSDTGKLPGTTVTLDWITQKGRSGTTKPKTTNRKGVVKIKLKKYKLADVITVTMNQIEQTDFEYNGAKNVKYENDCRLFSTECPDITIVQSEQD